MKLNPIRTLFEALRAPLALKKCASIPIASHPYVKQQKVKMSFTCVFKLEEAFVRPFSPYSPPPLNLGFSQMLSVATFSESV